MKILIVDDSQAIAFLVQLLLEEEGFQVMVAHDGKEGYVAYLHFEPDLVITDLHMPRRNGMELMELIRGQNPTIKGIYMSGDPGEFQPLLDEEIEKHGMSFLMKPFSKSELMKSLSPFLSCEESCVSQSHRRVAAPSKTTNSIGGRV